MIKDSIKSLIEGNDLSKDEMYHSMSGIMEGKAEDAQIASFLTALRIKGETIDEITAAAMVMREKVLKINAPDDVIDTCGTGGDLRDTFNISTTTALVIAACAIPIAKHGNRSVSSRSGSADLLEALGIKIDLEPTKAEQLLRETNFCFLFAPLYHPAMKYAIGPRKAMGVRTIFNILGPITNPAGAKRQIVGVFSGKYIEPMAKVLGNLGSTDVMVLHGDDGVDEISITGKTAVCRFKGGEMENLSLSPEDFGVKRAELTEIKGGDRDENAKITLNILKGERGPKRDTVIINAAAAALVSGKCIDFKTGVQIAEEAIDSGKAINKLEEIKRVSNSI